jgi:quercetin dioxygenase-like cupin family protein
MRVIPPAVSALLAALLTLGGGAVFADPPADVMTITRSQDVELKPSPVVPGAANAVISGDPKGPGQVYVVRNRFAPGVFSPPHFHPETRYITVLKGTWYVGYGPVQDLSKTTPVPAGSFVVHYPNKIHWDGAKDEEVIVQIMGVGPSGTIRVDENGKPKQ